MKKYFPKIVSKEMKKSSFTLYFFPIILIIFASCSQKVANTKIDDFKDNNKDRSIEDYLSKIPKDLPKWMINLPVNDKYIFASGTNFNKVLQDSIDRASNDAFNRLTVKLSGQIMSALKIFASEIKSDDMFIINNQITKSSSIESIKDSIIGYQTIDTRIIKDGVLFRTFILVRYPIKELNKLILRAVESNKNLEKLLLESESYQLIKSSIEK
jgi:hypothetical protein